MRLRTNPRAERLFRRLPRFTALSALFSAYVGWVAVMDNFGSSRRAALMPLKTLVWTSLVSLAAGSYLLVSGRAIHRCLMSVPAGSGEADPVAGFSDRELTAFTAWL